MVILCTIEITKTTNDSEILFDNYRTFTRFSKLVLCQERGASFDQLLQEYTEICVTGRNAVGPKIKDPIIVYRVL